MLCALLLRATLEGDATDPDRERARALMAAVEEWLTASGADSELEPLERRILAAAPGSLSADDQARCGWLGEGAVVIAWALGRAQLPAAGVAGDASRVAEDLEFLADSGGTLYTRARLRPRASLLQALELIELAGSRLWAALEPAATAERAPSLARFRSADYSWPEGVAPFEFVADDLALDGHALAALPRTRLVAAWCAMRERRRAARWLLGAATLYSEADGAAEPEPEL